MNTRASFDWRWIAAAAVAVMLAQTATALAAPPRLSRDASRPSVAATYGSSNFGEWRTDWLGLPTFRYTTDPDRDARAAQPELKGNTDAWHQLGNDHIVATAHNRGYVQFWSQDRLYQWLNRYEPDRQHYAGGYGYLRVGDGRTISTFYSDRPEGSTTERDYGAGYFRKRTASDPVDIEEHVYSPFGDDPVLLHDVKVTNTSSAPVEASWFEYWDVNPLNQFRKNHRGLGLPAWDEGSKTLSVDQLPEGDDTRPLTIFASALQGPVADWETDALRFFGTGDRAHPAAVEAGKLGGGIAAPVPTGVPGKTLFAFRAPLSLAPGESVTLRYAYGAAHREQVGELAERWRAAGDPLARSQEAWRDWLPQTRFGADHRWLARELQWDAYMLRSGTTYEEACGHHILSQGGYYQYEAGIQAAYRDPLQHVLPLIWADPELTRETIRYLSLIHI